MELTPKISVIIPVYKVEQYLRCCLDSVINQTYRNLEIICINDGSPDNSLAILEEYAAKDDRVIVINQENSGVSAARNAGLDKATGEYIAFVDADDVLELDMYALAKDVICSDSCLDMIYWGVNVIDTTKERGYLVSNFKSFCKGREKLTSALIAKMHMAPFAKLYKTSIIKSQGIKFNTNYKLSEDVLFNMQYMSFIDVVYFIDKNSYNYVVRSGSAMDNLYFNNKKFVIENYINIYKELFAFFAMNNNVQNFFILYNRALFDRILNNMINISVRIKINLLNKFRAVLQDINAPLNIDYDMDCILKGKYHRIEYLKIFSISKMYKKIRNLIFSTKTVNNHKIIRILGLKFKLKKENKSGMSNRQLIDIINKQLNTLVVHQRNFAKYKNYYEGKTVVLCGAGPTLALYRPLPDSIHIAANRAFLHDSVDFDYIFSQDWRGVSHIQEEFINYRPQKCIKFIGTQSDNPEVEIPEEFVLKSNGLRYNTDNECWPNSKFALDISTTPFGNFHTVSLVILQFILYTNPKRIYIVGCDNTPNGHFNTSNENTNELQEQLAMQSRFNKGLLADWAKAKDFINLHYPSTEIISINPIGLKGLFRDVYTQEYVEQNPELFINRNPEIIEM